MDEVLLAAQAHFGHMLPKGAELFAGSFVNMRDGWGDEQQDENRGRGSRRGSIAVRGVTARSVKTVGD